MADFSVNVGGTLTMTGKMTGRSPDWLPLNDQLRWMGEWEVGIAYDTSDAVIYRAESTEEWHVFVSKVSHNQGNIPDTSVAFWRRLYQEQWK